MVKTTTTKGDATTRATCGDDEDDKKLTRTNDNNNNDDDGQKAKKKNKKQASSTTTKSSFWSFGKKKKTTTESRNIDNDDDDDKEDGDSDDENDQKKEETLPKVKETTTLHADNAQHVDDNNDNPNHPTSTTASVPTEISTTVGKSWFWSSRKSNRKSKQENNNIDSHHYRTDEEESTHHDNHHNDDDDDSRALTLSSNMAKYTRNDNDEEDASISTRATGTNFNDNYNTNINNYDDDDDDGDTDINSEDGKYEDSTTTREEIKPPTRTSIFGIFGGGSGNSSHRKRSLSRNSHRKKKQDDEGDQSYHSRTNGDKEKNNPKDDTIVDNNSNNNETTTNAGNDNTIPNVSDEDSTAVVTSPNESREDAIKHHKPKSASGGLLGFFTSSSGGSKRNERTTATTTTSVSTESMEQNSGVQRNTNNNNHDDDTESVDNIVMTKTTELENDGDGDPDKSDNNNDDENDAMTTNDEDSAVATANNRSSKSATTGTSIFGIFSSRQSSSTPASQVSKNNNNEEESDGDSDDDRKNDITDLSIEPSTENKETPETTKPNESIDHFNDADENQKLGKIATEEHTTAAAGQGLFGFFGKKKSTNPFDDDDDDESSQSSSEENQLDEPNVTEHTTNIDKQQSDEMKHTSDVGSNTGASPNSRTESIEDDQDADGRKKDKDADMDDSTRSGRSIFGIFRLSKPQDPILQDADQDDVSEEDPDILHVNTREIKLSTSKGDDKDDGEDAAITDSQSKEPDESVGEYDFGDDDSSSLQVEDQIDKSTSPKNTSETYPHESKKPGNPDVVEKTQPQVVTSTDDEASVDPKMLEDSENKAIESELEGDSAHEKSQASQRSIFGMFSKKRKESQIEGDVTDNEGATEDFATEETSVACEGDEKPSDAESVKESKDTTAQQGSSPTEWVEAVKKRHEELIEFEQERGKAFQSQFISLQAYTQVFSEIAEESLSEMQRLSGFVGGVWTAQKRFSEIMAEKQREAMITRNTEEERHQEIMLSGDLRSTFDTQHMAWTDIVELKQQHRDRLDVGLQPPSATDNLEDEFLGLDDLADRWGMRSDEPPEAEEAPISIIPSAFSPLIEALEVSQGIWESKFTQNSKQTAKTIVHTLATTWPLEIQAQAEQLTKITEEVFPEIKKKQKDIEEAWGKLHHRIHFRIYLRILYSCLMYLVFHLPPKEHYESAVQAAKQSFAAHQKAQKYTRSMFSRTTVDPAEQERALLLNLGDNPDVWMAERAYQRCVDDLAKYWKQRVVGNVITREDDDEKQVDGEKQRNDSQDTLGENQVENTDESNAIDTNEAEDIASNLLTVEGDDYETVPLRVFLQKMAETEAARRTDLSEKLKEWVTGQERLLVGSEAATGLGWMDWVPQKNQNDENKDIDETETGHNNDANIDDDDDDDDDSRNEQSSQPGQTGGETDSNLIEVQNPTEDKTDNSPTVKLTASELEDRRAQVREHIEKALTEKYSNNVAQDWLHTSAHAEETLMVMDDVFGYEAYLESPHVVSAAVGEWWIVPRRQTSDNKNAQQQMANLPIFQARNSSRHLALVIISSAPQMHIFNLDGVAGDVDLETPPHDALLELLSNQSLPKATLSIPMADTQVKQTDELDTLEIIPPVSAHGVPCIRLLCPHLSNIY